ncbi:MAG: hypothetical protein OXR66_06780 [Candidatus Woesearchaeota archaeon]|nr:hypothetical protein [Candidatus Woesearchaeota archaeon]
MIVPQVLIMPQALRRAGARALEQVKICAGRQLSAKKIAALEAGFTQEDPSFGYNVHKTRGYATDEHLVQFTSLASWMFDGMLTTRWTVKETYSRTGALQEVERWYGTTGKPPGSLEGSVTTYSPGKLSSERRNLYKHPEAA